MALLSGKQTCNKIGNKLFWQGQEKDTMMRKNKNMGTGSFLWGM